MIRASAEFGLEVPRDLSVVGTDDIPLASHLPKALTTIACDLETVVETAIDHLLRLIETRDQNGERGFAPTDTTIPTRLVIRETTREIG